MRKKKQLTNRELLIEQCLYDAYCEENNIINEGWWDDIKAGTAGFISGAGAGLRADAANSFKLRSRDQIKNDRNDAYKQAAQPAKIKSYANSLAGTLKSFIQAGGKLGTHIDDENDVLQRLERIKQGLDPGFDARMRQKAEQYDRRMEREQRRQTGNQVSSQNKASSQEQNSQNNTAAQNNATTRVKTDNELAAEKEAAKRQASNNKSQTQKAPASAPKNKGQEQSFPTPTSVPSSAPTNEEPQQYSTQQSGAQNYSPHQQESQVGQDQKDNRNWFDRGMRTLGRAYGSVRNMGKNFTAGRLEKDATAMSDKLDAKEKVREQQYRTNNPVISDGQRKMLDTIDQPVPVESPKTPEQPEASTVPKQSAVETPAEASAPEQPVAPQQDKVPIDAQVSAGTPAETPAEAPAPEQPADSDKSKEPKGDGSDKKKKEEYEDIKLADVPGVDRYGPEAEERPQRKKITESRYNFTNTKGQISMLNSIL